MKKAFIKAVYNYGNVTRFVIYNSKNIHGIFCEFARQLGLSKDSVIELDIPFENLTDEYLFLEEKEYEFHIFITEKYVNLIIKTKNSLEELKKCMDKFFVFPGKAS